jgi:hypothetical protein
MTCSADAVSFCPLDCNGVNALESLLKLHALLSVMLRSNEIR